MFVYVLINSSIRWLVVLESTLRKAHLTGSKNKVGFCYNVTLKAYRKLKVSTHQNFFFSFVHVLESKLRCR